MTGIPGDLAALDVAHVLHPHAAVGGGVWPLIVASGTGATITDVDGKEYIDGTCGLWQCAIGHGREELADVAAEQMRRLEFYPSFWDLSNEPAIRLAARLAELAPQGVSHVFYTNGGSEGIETAIKAVRLAWHVQGQTDRKLILSRASAYHGVASASLAATGIPPLKEGFDPLAPGFIHLTAPHPLMLPPDGTAFLVDELERTIADVGANKIAAFVGEPIMGVGGMIPPPEGYWAAVQAVLRRHGILLVLDEVVTAYGRTGHWFGADLYGIDADLIVTAKALTSGYVPMGAVLFGDRVVEMLRGTAFRHGFTYNGHPVGAAVALENLAIIEREGLLDRTREMGAVMLDGLKPLGALDAVAEVRGVGLMLGIELREGHDAAPVAAGARDDGVIVRATGQKIVLSPPLVIERDQVDRVVDVLGRQLERL
jgi:putrescine aminotransferase